MKANKVETLFHIIKKRVRNDIFVNNYGVPYRYIKEQKEDILLCDFFTIVIVFCSETNLL